MTLQWEAPTLQFTGTGSRTWIDVTMRETPFRLGSGEYEDWIACREAWRASKTKDVSSWRKYRDFVESGRYHFVDRKGDAPYGFAEAFVALALHRRGFTCWDWRAFVREATRQRRASPKEHSGSGGPTEEGRDCATERADARPDAGAEESRRRRLRQAAKGVALL